MQWWNSLRLRTKFISGIVLAMLVTVSSVVVSAWTFNNLRDTTDRLYMNTRLNALVLGLEVQHLQWVNTLSAYLVNPEVGELTLATDPTQCGLGKWYYGGGKAEAVARLPGLENDLNALEGPHKALHATATTIVGMKRDGDDTGARTEFQTETLPALRTLQERLASVRVTVAEDVAAQRKAFDLQAREASIAMLALGVASIFALGALALILFYSILKPCQEIILYSKKCRDGATAPLDLKRSDELGQLAGNLADLTQHLQKELAFSKGVLDGITVPCAVFCPEDKTIFTNKQMLDLLERDEVPEECKGLTSGELAWGEKGRETLSSKALKDRCLVHSKLEFVTRKGKGKHVMVTSAPLYDTQENLLGTIAVWVDITEVVEKQQALEEKSAHIAAMAAQAQQIANAVSAASDELAGKVSASNLGALEQRDRMTETASAMAEMNATVLEVARSAADAAGHAEEANGTAREGAVAVKQVIESIGQVAQYAGQMKTGIHQLGSRADGIGDIITIIDDIADQTNLLALNAAIEAARAGEAGRGFAVVAAEVRKLAEKTMQATNEVGTAVRGIQDGTHENMRQVDDASRAVETATGLAVKAGEHLERIVRLVENTAVQIHAIAAASEEQSATSEEINRALEEVSRIAEETFSAMEVATSSVEGMAGEAQNLRGIIERLQ